MISGILILSVLLKCMECSRFPISKKDRWDRLECDGGEDEMILGYVQPRVPSSDPQASQIYPQVRNLRQHTYLHVSSLDIIANWTEDTCQPHIADVLFKFPTTTLNLVISYNIDDSMPEDCKSEFGAFFGFIERFRPALTQAGFRSAIVTVYEEKSADAMKVKNELTLSLPVLKIPSEIEGFGQKLVSYGADEPHVYMMLLLSPWPNEENSTLEFLLENCTFHMGRIHQVSSGSGSFPKTWVPVVAVLFLAIPLAGFCYCLYRCIRYRYLKGSFFIT